jgi:hypothetical protein
VNDVVDGDDVLLIRLLVVGLLQFLFQQRSVFFEERHPAELVCFAN